MAAADSSDRISKITDDILGTIRSITGCSVLSRRDKVQFVSLKKLIEAIQDAFGKTKRIPEQLLDIWLDQVKIVLQNLDTDLSNSQHSGEKNACMPMASFFSQSHLLMPKTRAVAARLEGLVAIGTKLMGEPGGHENLSDAYRKIESVWNHPDNSVSSTQLKQCFAYCSLFPEDCVIDTHRLIYLWMAEGFLGESDDMVNLGIKYAHLLQLVENDDFKMNSVRTCKMSPVMHDLATLVAGIQGTWNPSDQRNPPDQRAIRRVSFDFSLYLSRDIRDFDKSEIKEELRTILMPVASQQRLRRHLQIKEEWSSSRCNNLFSKFKILCVLDLHDLGIKQLPSSIGEMENLKFLDLSHNAMEKLPSAMTKLLKLQTLKLSHCHLLETLPRNFYKLKSLRHLDLEACQNLTRMPPKIGCMIWLQTLSHFVVSKHKHRGALRQLSSFKNLRGGLEILHLQRLKFHSSDGGGVDYVKGISNLERLSLRWDHDNDKQLKKDKDKDRLRGFEPPENLKVLSIMGYKGEGFPDWQWSSLKLVKFSLYNCSKCKSLSPMDQFPSLKVLELRRLESLTSITTKHQTDLSSSSFFTSLKQLILFDSPNLESWWSTEEATTFHCISKLQVQYCPKLNFMPLYPVLDDELVMRSSCVEPLLRTMESGIATAAVPSPGMIESGITIATVPSPLSKLKSMELANVMSGPPEFQKMLVNLTSLKKLHIRECPNLQYLPKGFSKLSSLEELIIENCKLLDLLENKEVFRDLNKLESLSIVELPILKYLPTLILKAKSLKTLRIHGCPELKRLLYRSMETQDFPLEKLEISECPKLVLLPYGMKHLQTFKILGCRRLTPRLKRDTGDIWERISHVKNILSDKQLKFTFGQDMDLPKQAKAGSSSWVG